MNTSDVVIVCMGEDEAIRYIERQSGLKFKKLTDDTHNLTIFDVWGLHARPDLSEHEVQTLIEAFNNAPMDAPELASMIMTHDYWDQYDGVYTKREEEERKET